MNRRNCSILIAKLKFWRGGPSCVGYLTPVEIKYLLAHGCHADRKDEWRDKWIETAIASGEGGGTWYYFHPSKEILAEVRDSHKKYKRHG